jgi:hypothetical protein
VAAPTLYKSRRFLHGRLAGGRHVDQVGRYAYAKGRFAIVLVRALSISVVRFHGVGRHTARYASLLRLAQRKNFCAKFVNFISEQPRTTQDVVNSHILFSLQFPETS